MSIILEQGTRPAGVEVKTSFANRVWLGTKPGTCFGDADIDMSLADFTSMVLYVLTNTDLEPNDPRLPLVERIKEMRMVPGYNSGGYRLE